MTNEKKTRNLLAGVTLKEVNLNAEAGSHESEVLNEFLGLMNAIVHSAETFESDGKFGLKNAKGEILLAPEFESFMGLNGLEINKGDRVVAKQDGRYGVVLADGTGTWILPPLYDYIGYPNNLTHVRKGDKWGVINLVSGEFVIPPDCDSVDDYDGFMFFNDIGFYEKDGKTGVIMYDGMFTEPIFDEAERGLEGYVRVKFGGDWGFINKDGQFTTNEDEAGFKYYM